MHAIPYLLQPSYTTQSTRACRLPLLHHIRSRILYHASLSNHNFFDVLFSVLPFDADYYLSCNVLTEHIVVVEYGEVIISILQTPSISNTQQCLQRWLQKKEDYIIDATNRIQNISSTWPTVVPDNIVFECLKNYRHHTIWIPLLVCCVCGLERKEVTKIVVDNHLKSPLFFSLLHVKDPFIVNFAEFQYGFIAINDGVLDKSGLITMDKDCIELQICDECYSALKCNHVPRLSLANYLYRGKLPNEFRDLTWIEEMVCAKYRNTAHVTRIFGSSDSSQPKVFHGNTCVHEMNVLSTATVLPCTVADINDMLGAEKRRIPVHHIWSQLESGGVWRTLLHCMLRYY